MIMIINYYNKNFPIKIRKMNKFRMIKISFNILIIKMTIINKTRKIEMRKINRLYIYNNSSIRITLMIMELIKIKNNRPEKSNLLFVCLIYLIQKQNNEKLNSLIFIIIY